MATQRRCPPAGRRQFCLDTVQQASLSTYMVCESSQAISPIYQEATHGAEGLCSVDESEALVRASERFAFGGRSREGIHRRHRLPYTVLLLAHWPTLPKRSHINHTVDRNNITIREDQPKWVEKNYLNLSSFVHEKTDDSSKNVRINR
jgi:hypothetical protein